jgi:hypothetical protein
MRKFFGALAALALAAGMLIGFSTPAQAYSDAQCFDLYEGDAQTCVQYYWKRQLDGTGIDLYRVEVGTFDCGELESVDPYTGMDMWLINPNNNNIPHETHPGATNCNPTFTMDWDGRDDGGMWFQWDAKARLDLAGDRAISFKVHLAPDGVDTVVWRNNVPV